MEGRGTGKVVYPAVQEDRHRFDKDTQGYPRMHARVCKLGGYTRAQGARGIQRHGGYK